MSTTTTGMTTNWKAIPCVDVTVADEASGACVNACRFSRAKDSHDRDLGRERSTCALLPTREGVPGFGPVPPPGSLFLCPRVPDLRLLFLS